MIDKLCSIHYSKISAILQLVTAAICYCNTTSTVLYYALSRNTVATVLHYVPAAKAILTVSQSFQIHVVLVIFCTSEGRKRRHPVVIIVILQKQFGWWQKLEGSIRDIDLETNHLINDISTVRFVLEITDGFLLQ